jgi:hypothetical protein
MDFKNSLIIALLILKRLQTHYFTGKDVQLYILQSTLYIRLYVDAFNACMVF